MKGKTTLCHAIVLALLISPFSSFSQDNTFSYICPQNGSKNLNPEQNFIFKSMKGIDQESFDPGYFSVRGTVSGNLEYDILFSVDGKTLILKPISCFARGETVTIQYTGGLLTTEQEFLSPVVFRGSVQNFDKEEM